MRVNKVLERYGNKGQVIRVEMICEHCGAAEVRCGNDDESFYARRVPAMICKKCGRVAEPAYPHDATDN